MMAAELGSTEEERFARAQSLHRDGRLEEAGPLYDSVLAADPAHLGALLYLGTLRLQQGRAEESAALMRRALTHNPGSAEAHANLAAALQALGHHEEAIAGYERALAIDPSLADASCALGSALQALGRCEEAILHYRAALARRPDFAEASYGLATAHQTLRRYDEAIESYRAALAADPDYAEASCGLAAVLHTLGRHEEAVAHYESALDVDPDFVEANTGLAGALNALERHDEAIECCQKALAVDPHHAEAHEFLGDALQAIGSQVEAVDCYEKAITFKPKLFSAYHGYAAALQVLNRHQEAIAVCERALTLGPARFEMYNKLGQLLQEVGRLEGACRAFEKAIEAAPNQPGLYYSLFQCLKMTANNPHLARLEALARDPESLPENARMHLDFALGKAYADLGQNEQSFRHLLDGNARKRRQLEYDEAAAMRWYAETERVLSAAVIRRCRGWGHPDPTPVFIVGMPRSGTTLIEQILASHPEVHAGGERKDFGEATQRLLEWTMAGAADGQAMLGATHLRSLGAGYVAGLAAEAPAAKTITDKMPGNFWHVGLIHLALPNARIIHARRDPIDTCLSCFSKLFAADGLPFTYDLAELGRYYRTYERLMEHWRRVLPEGVMLEIRYEELIGEFEKVARRMLAHCGLEWDDACRTFYETPRPVKTASFAQVRQPIYKSSLRRWRPEEAVLRPLIEGLELRG